MIRFKTVLIPFPFDDLSTNKVRPAVCLTERIGQHEHVVVAFITSKIPADLLDSDLIINTALAGFPECGLKVSSTLRLHRLMTISSRMILRELGTLPTGLQLAIEQKLSKLFQLPERT